MNSQSDMARKPCKGLQQAEVRTTRVCLKDNKKRWPPNNSLQLTRLACGKLERALPARMRENGSTVARAAGQLSSRPLARPCAHGELGSLRQAVPAFGSKSWS